MFDPYFSDKVVIIHKAVAGIGPTCRGFPWCRPRYYRQPPLPQMMLTWKTRMMDCFGLPNSLTARADKPYLLFINRPKATGRAFLNLPEIVQHVRVWRGLIWQIYHTCLARSAMCRIYTHRQDNHLHKTTSTQPPQCNHLNTDRAPRV